MTKRIYLDNNATTHLTPHVRAALHEVIDVDPGNPESAHSDGDVGRKIVSAARLRIAEALNAQDDQIIFTGSGSESNSNAVQTVLRLIKGQDGARVLTSDLEHSSIVSGLSDLERRGIEVVRLPVEANGVIDVDALVRECDHGCAAIFLQWANNETGVVQPVQTIGDIAKERELYFHIDAAQAFGRELIDVDVTHCTSLTLTAHKIHGPKGVAVLYSEVPKRIAPIIYGGQQEYGIRGGTHNTIGVRGLDAATEERFDDFDSATTKLRSLRDRLENLVIDRMPGVRIQGADAPRVVNTTCLTFPGADGTKMIAWLDAHGLQCSQSSACRSRRPEPSAVLRAMGVTADDAYSTIRFSVSVLNEIPEMDTASELISRAYNESRA